MVNLGLLLGLVSGFLRVGFRARRYIWVGVGLMWGSFNVSRSWLRIYIFRVGLKFIQAWINIYLGLVWDLFSVCFQCLFRLGLGSF